jgi:hypothetical protein
VCCEASVMLPIVCLVLLYCAECLACVMLVLYSACDV